jgi:Uma2 family endonuclease
MVQAAPKPLTFEQFVDWYPEVGRYELHEGVIIELQPTGSHEEVTAFIIGKAVAEIDRLQLPYFIPPRGLIKPLTTDSGYQPDVIILDREALADEPLWQKRATVSQGKTVKLIVEVPSTNWRADYFRKLSDYEEMGIPEYWIADHLGIGATRYIGSPKAPTLSIYTLINGEYQVNQFRKSDRIVSILFPDLNLTADQVLKAGKRGE